MSAGQPETGDLAGRTFTSTVVTVGGQARPLVDGTHAVLGFTDRDVSLHAGCNQMSGRARLAGGRLVVSALGGTEMGCQPRLMEQDSWLGAFLTDGPSLALAGDTLTLTSGTTTIELSAQQATNAALVGTTWQLEGIVTGSGPEASVGSVPVGVRSTVRFTGGDTIQLSPGCNDAEGQVEIGEASITFGGIATTDVFCDGSAGAVEQGVFDLLTGDVAYEIDGDSLQLTRGDAGLVYRAT